MDTCDPWELELIKDPEHYLYDSSVERELHENTVRNMMKYGVIQPVIVAMEGSRKIVVAGRRRTLHLREANRLLSEEGALTHKMPYIVRRTNRKDLYGIFLSENMCRRELSVLEKARMAENYRIAHGATTDDLCTCFDTGYQTIADWRRLLEIEEEVLDMVEAGRLSATTALKLHGLEPEEQVRKAKAAIEHAEQKGSKRATTLDPDRIKPPTKKVLQRFVESKPKALTEDFLKGMQYARGLITAEDAGVDDVLAEWRTADAKRPAKKAKK